MTKEEKALADIRNAEKQYRESADAYQKASDDLDRVIVEALPIGSIVKVRRGMDPLKTGRVREHEGGSIRVNVANNFGEHFDIWIDSIEVEAVEEVAERNDE